MKIGDLARYKPFPPTELHRSGLIGLVISNPYTRGADSSLHVVDVIWNMDRGLSYPAGTVSWDYIDELEVIK